MTTKLGICKYCKQQIRWEYQFSEDQYHWIPMEMNGFARHTCSKTKTYPSENNEDKKEVLTENNLEKVNASDFASSNNVETNYYLELEKEHPNLQNNSNWLQKIYFQLNKVNLKERSKYNSKSEQKKRAYKLSKMSRHTL